MENDLNIRLQAYFTAAAPQIPGASRLYADALASSDAASTAVSAAIICSHPRELRGDSLPSDLRPGQDELDLLAAEKPTADDVPQPLLLPPRSGNFTVEDLALGAERIPAIKNRND